MYIRAARWRAEIKAQLRNLDAVRMENTQSVWHPRLLIDTKNVSTLEKATVKIKG